MFICMLAAGICFGCSSTFTGKEEVQTEFEEEPVIEETLEIPVKDAVSEDTKETFIYVHVCGEVVRPGVYELPEGSRIYEALEAAGGITEEGAADYLNLALKLEDGMKLEVPDEETAVRMKAENRTFSVAGGQTEAGKVNLNTASREELMTLKGIGASRAEAIIQYREDFGAFESIEDVMKVSGIKQSAFDKIKDDITT